MRRFIIELFFQYHWYVKLLRKSAWFKSITHEIPTKSQSLNFIHTAAHCIVDKISNYQRTVSEIELFFNVHDLKTRKISSDVSSIILHPDWNISNENYDADIALLKLRESHKHISPICMPQNFITSNYGIVLSWIDMEPNDPGYFNHKFDSSFNYPIEYVMPIRSIMECVQLQPRFTSIASNRTFCAGGLNSVACLEVANSGASMSIKENDTFYLFGIVSSSFIDLAGCDNITFTLLTEVKKFHDWLDENINSFSGPHSIDREK